MRPERNKQRKSAALYWEMEYTAAVNVEIIRMKIVLCKGQ